MLKAMLELGVSTRWMADVVQAGGRTLVVDEETNLVIGEILANGDPVAFDPPYPFEGEES